MPESPYDNPADGSRVRVVDTDAEPWEKSYAMWIHLGVGFSAMLAAVVNVMFFLPLVFALIMWQVKKDESPLVDDHGREAVNFQISLFLLGLIGLLIGIVTCGVGLMVVLPGLFILQIVGLVMAAIAGARGEYFRYPMCFRVLHG